MTSPKINTNTFDFSGFINNPYFDLLPESTQKFYLDYFKKIQKTKVCEDCGTELIMTCFSQDADGNREEWLLACPECT